MIKYISIAFILCLVSATVHSTISRHEKHKKGTNTHKHSNKVYHYKSKILTKAELKTREHAIFKGAAMPMLKRQEIGGRCKDTLTDCNVDLYCSSKTNKCVRKVAEGRICESDEHCKEGLTCGADSVCTHLNGEVGDYCHDTADCADKLVCGSKIHKCAVKCSVGTSENGNNSPDCKMKQECVDGICVGMNYGPCKPICGKNLQCNRLTDKCRPKTMQLDQCDDIHKMKCVKNCLTIEPHNPDRIVYCGFCCINNCRCYNGPGWFKLVPKYFLDMAVGPYQIAYAANMNITHNRNN